MTYGYDGRYFKKETSVTLVPKPSQKAIVSVFSCNGSGMVHQQRALLPRRIKKVVNKLKLRFSVGRTGNDDTGGNRFLYRGTMKQDNSGYNLGFSNSGAMGGVGNGITEAQFESPFLSWEIEDKQNFGIDLGLFDNRIDLQVDYFNNQRKAILLQRNIVSNVTGFQQMPWQNFGIVKTRVWTQV